MGRKREISISTPSLLTREKRTRNEGSIINFTGREIVHTRGSGHKRKEKKL